MPRSNDEKELLAPFLTFDDHLPLNKLAIVGLRVDFEFKHASRMYNEFTGIVYAILELARAVASIFHRSKRPDGGCFQCEQANIMLDPSKGGRSGEADSARFNENVGVVQSSRL